MDIRKISFGKFEAYELTNSAGSTVKILNYGARIASWIFNGVEIVLGYDSSAEAYELDTAYLWVFEVQ